MRLVAISVLVLAALAVAQSVVVRDVTALCGNGVHGVYFERGGTIWVTDGTPAGTLDTGVSRARAAVQGGRLCVYAPAQVAEVFDDGSVRATPVPVAFEGVDAGAAGPRIWRRLWSTRAEEVLELHELTATGWVRVTHGVSDPLAMTWVEAVEVRPDRYLVLWSDDSFTDVYDLFDGRVHGGTGTGTCSRTWRWSSGVLACAEDGWNQADAFAWFEDFGPAGETALPPSWGWGSYAFHVEEPTAGFPFVASDARAEIVPFRIDARVRPRPGEVVHGLCWFQGGALLLADATALGVRRIASWSGADWVSVPALAGLRGLAPLGELGARSFLLAGDALVCVDAGTATVTTLLTGLAAAAGFLPLRDGFLFVADDGVHGGELWFSGGTASSTRLVADLWPGRDGSSPRGLTAVDGRVVFVADDGTGAHLFALDELELDWVRSPVDGRWYRQTAPDTWPSAERAARRLGGELVTVRSQPQQDWLWRTFGHANLWIGLQDLDRDGAYSWVSGEPVGFTAWCPGEPDHGTPDEVVVRLTDRPGVCAGGWSDHDLADRHSAIVERARAPAPVEEFGAGCDGAPYQVCASYGPATLAFDGGRPAPGGAVSLVLDARQLPSSRPGVTGGVVLVGLDSTAWGGVPLPFDLAAIGWQSGCRLWVSIEDAQPLALDAFGRGPWRLAIPADPALAGAVVFAQGLAWSGALGDPCNEATNAVRITVVR